MTGVRNVFTLTSAVVSVDDLSDSSDDILRNHESSTDFQMSVPKMRRDEIQIEITTIHGPPK